jgi:hypothetical protein
MEKEGTIMSKDFRLTIELVPRPCWYSNMRTTIPRAAWDKLRKQVYAQYNYCCGVCQVEHVTLHCHEIWQYDDTLHSQKLNGFIALCEMCHHCKHIGHAGILARHSNHFSDYHRHSRSYYSLCSLSYQKEVASHLARCMTRLYGSGKAWPSGASRRWEVDEFIRLEFLC